MSAPSNDIPARALRAADELDAVGTYCAGRAAQVIRELVSQNTQLVAAMADAARAVATATTERCAGVADAVGAEYTEAARMTPPGATDALSRASCAELIARKIRATGKVGL